MPGTTQGRYHPGIGVIIDDVIPRLWFELGIQTVNAGTPFTPDFTQGGIIQMAALPAPITVNAPSVSVKGMLGCFMWLQDGAGGRGITYNAIYHTVGAAAFVTTASTMTIDWFMYDSVSSVWRLFNRITGQT